MPGNNKIVWDNAVYRENYREKLVNPDKVEKGWI